MTAVSNSRRCPFMNAYVPLSLCDLRRLPIGHPCSNDHLKRGHHEAPKERCDMVQRRRFTPE